MSGLSLDQFLANDDKTAAAERYVTIVGEAANMVSDETKAKYPNVPWREAADIVLGSSADSAVVKYTLNEHERNLFAVKYHLSLPTVEELQRKLRRERACARSCGASRRLDCQVFAMTQERGKTIQLHYILLIYCAYNRLCPIDFRHEI